MKLSEIHTAIDTRRGPELPEDQAFATLVAIEHLARTEGLPVSALDFAAPGFSAKYLYERKDLSDAWSGRTQYLAWRNIILNAQMRFAPGDVDGDPWRSLGRAERLLTGRKDATLHGLYTLLPAGTRPQGVTEALLTKVCGDIPSAERQKFRAGVNAFRKLFRNSVALRSGLLPDACPGPLPGLRDHRLLTPMSPEIEDWRSGLGRETITSLDYLYRLAVAGGRLNGKTDTLDDLRAAICDLPNPADVGIPSIRGKTLYAYIGMVRRKLGGPDLRKTRAGQAWAELRTAARAAGCETSSLWAVSKPAAARGLFPGELTCTIALEIIRSYKDRSAACRRGCEQFDALRGLVPEHLVPPVPLNLRRRPPPTPRQSCSLRPTDPVKTAWADLYARLRRLGWSHKETSMLSYLRVRAGAAGIAPGALSHEFIENLERQITMCADRTRLRAAAISVSALSKEPDFSDLPNLSIPDDRRLSHGGPSEKARAELEELMEFMNPASATRRGYRVAVGVLTDAMGRPDIPLKEILQTDMSAYDIGPHEPRRKFHTNIIRNLREFLELPWTSAWRELQRVVISTGMLHLNNPVPKVLAWNPGADPDGLTRDWAQRLDREYRSTLKNPPHGRADIALRLAGHLRAFDALHDIPAVARSGLLPARIGPIR